MFHIILLGFFLGFGLAMSVGPVTLLIIRINLAQGFQQGMLVGLGAICADFTYLALLATGSLLFLQEPLVLKVIGVLGAIILCYFGIKTMRSPIVISAKNAALPKKHHNFITGYLICISSPLSILFWIGLASEVAEIAAKQQYAVYYFGLGLFLGVFTWLVMLNGVLSSMRHQISPKILNIFNQIGGLVIIVFGVYGLVKVTV